MQSLVVEDSAYSKLTDAMICEIEANDQEKRAEDWHQLEEKSYVDGAFGSPVHTQLHDFVVPKEEGEAEKWNANPASPASLSISHKRPCYGWIKSDDEEPTQLKDTDSVVVPIKVEAENWNANPASLPLSHERPCYGWIESDDEEPSNGGFLSSMVKGVGLGVGYKMLDVFMWYPRKIIRYADACSKHYADGDAW